MSDTNTIESFAELYKQCTTAFQDLLVRLKDPAHPAAERESLQLDEALKDYGKLRIWAEQTRVFLPPNARGSLDEIVRDRAKTKRIFFSTLRQLVSLLHTG